LEQKKERNIDKKLNKNISTQENLVTTRKTKKTIEPALKPEMTKILQSIADFDNKPKINKSQISRKFIIENFQNTIDTDDIIGDNTIVIEYLSSFEYGKLKNDIWKALTKEKLSSHHGLLLCRMNKVSKNNKKTIEELFIRDQFFFVNIR
jgi:hypothetical protein